MTRTDLHEKTQLHAYVDGQLDSEERERILIEANSDKELRETLCDLRRTKELVNHAYAGVKAPRRRTPAAPSRLRSYTGWSSAAVILLALGFISGWFSHLPAPSLPGFTTQSAQAQHVILHIGHGSHEKFEETLNRAEQLLSSYREQGIRVEIVANSDGLDLLRANDSPYVQRIRGMMRMYSDLRFVACSNTIARLEREGNLVLLIEDTQVAPSAVEHIVQRVKEGWTYIKV